MSKRKYREAAQAKRQDISDILPEFTQAELLAADKAYDAAKTDPTAWDQKIHALHQTEVDMLRHLRGAVV